MSAIISRCPSCRRPLPESAQDLAALQACPGCARPLEIQPFPGLTRIPAAGRPAESITGEGEAACFFHVTKKAVVPCDDCGRFLCALCDIELDGRHLCPSCLQAGQARGELPGLERSRTRWDLVVWFVNLGLLTCIGAPIIAILNIVITSLCWNKPGSRTANHRTSMLLGTLVSVGITVILAIAVAFALSKED